MNAILVTGGTGTLGRVVVTRLLEAGHEVRIASRRPQPAGAPRPYTWMTVDYRSGAGLAEAIAGVDAIVHCAGDLRGEVERQLVAAARGVGAPHLVHISIVGLDRVPLGFYRSRLAAERVIENSGLPWTILRATQFHDLIRFLLAVLARLPVMVVPDFSFQPIDVREVAGRLVELATGAPAGHVPDLGGPHVRHTSDLARAYLRSIGRRRRVLPVRLPGKVFRGYRQGGHLTPDRADGRITFEEYLTEHSAPASLSYRGRQR